MFQMNASSSDPNHRVLNNRQKLIHRAKMKSLRISVAIVAAFIVCWTPYYVSMLMFMFMNLDKRVFDSLHHFNCVFFSGNMRSARYVLATLWYSGTGLMVATTSNCAGPIGCCWRVFAPKMIQLKLICGGDRK